MSYQIMNIQQKSLPCIFKNISSFLSIRGLVASSQGKLTLQLRYKEKDYLRHACASLILPFSFIPSYSKQREKCIHVLGSLKENLTMILCFSFKKMLDFSQNFIRTKKRENKNKLSIYIKNAINFMYTHSQKTMPVFPCVYMLYLDFITHTDF